MDKNESIFSKVTEKEKLAVFTSAKLQNIELNFQLKNTLHKTRILKVESNDYITIYSDNNIFEKIEKSYIIFYFSLGLEKYFFSSNVRVHKQELIVPISSPLFLLQRRQSFRLPIPPTFNALYRVTQINNAHSSHIFKIKNISTNGFRLINPNQILKNKDELVGLVTLPNKEAIHMKCKVNNTYMNKTQPDLSTVGAQFVDLTNNSDTQLFKLIIDLHRELFVSAY